MPKNCVARRLQRTSSGQSIFEVILAIGIVTVVLVGIIALIVVVQRNTTAAKNRAEATRLTLQAQEWLREQRDRDWINFYNHTNTSWCFDSLGWTNSGACGANEYVSGTLFLRQIDFVRTTPNAEVRAEVKVQWSDSQGNHTINSSTILTNWKSR